MEATLYIGITLPWDYASRKVTLSMPHYVRKALHKFQNIHQGGPQYSPHACAPIIDGAKVQHADPLDTTE